jgi:hypothetical protein
VTTANTSTAWSWQTLVDGAWMVILAKCRVTLAREVETIQARGSPGPRFIIERVGEYLRGEQAAGRMSAAAPVDAAATALVRACIHYALSSFYNRGHGEDRDKAFAALADSVVTAILHGICPD